MKAGYEIINCEIDIEEDICICVANNHDTNEVLNMPYRLPIKTLEYEIGVWKIKQ